MRQRRGGPRLRPVPHYKERQDDGRWPEDPTNDVGRIARQQYFLKQAAKKAIARGARNPMELGNLIGIAQQYVDIDDVLTPQTILDLVSGFSAFDPEELKVFQPYTVRRVRPGPGGDGLDLVTAEPSRSSPASASPRSSRRTLPRSAAGDRATAS